MAEADQYGWYKKVLGCSPNSVWRKRSQTNEHKKYPSLNTMEKHLVKAGFKVVQEKLWAK
jgi:hypothetical protein